MHKAALLVAIVFFALEGVAGAQPAERMPVPPAQTAPDNTGRNVRDRSGATLTPGDQSESEDYHEQWHGHPAGARQECPGESHD